MPPICIIPITLAYNSCLLYLTFFILLLSHLQMLTHPPISNLTVSETIVLLFPEHLLLSGYLAIGDLPFPPGKFPFHSSFFQEGRVLCFVQRVEAGFSKQVFRLFWRSLKRTKGQIQLQWIRSHLKQKNLFMNPFKKRKGKTKGNVKKTTSR